MNVEQVLSIIKAAQRSGIYVRPYLNQNGTIDFSTLGNSDDGKLFLYTEHTNKHYLMFLCHYFYLIKIF